MIVDTSALLAFFDTDEPDHAAVSGVLARASEPLVVSPYVVAELDYLVASRLGGPAELVVLHELSSGAWDLAAFGSEDLAEARAVVERAEIADNRDVLLARQRNCNGERAVGGSDIALYE